MNIENYYLDLKKISRLGTQAEQNQIHSYYMDMMNSFMENRNSMGKSIMNTLIKGGYLVDARDKKLGELLND